MKNNSKFLFILTLVIVCLLYRVDSIVAMANMQSDTFGVEMVVAEPVTESAPAPDSISTGTALTEWLEAHKDTGGTVKLADNIILDGYYSFCPNGANMPAIVVDTDQYTITVTGEIELLSDDHLTFQGQPDGRGIFYVAEKSMLSLGGIAVESGQCALWQEEGAGLEVADCHISGNIHYADTPFVMYQKSICVVVEKEQTVCDVLPAQISCTVNRQGQVSYNELVPVLWNLEGCEKQQAERQRFQLQGSFLYAASAEPVLCTVVYNDYPLTITDVEASAGGGWYSFQGGYTTPGENPLLTIISEYSFDGENWFTCEEQTVSNTYAFFYIAFESAQWDMAVHPNVYIRLQCIDNESRCFSNVLYYTADNLECAQDIGGSRGGGTSIINPPDEPQKSNSGASSEEEGTAGKENHNADSAGAGSVTPSDTDQTDNRDGGAGTDAASDGQSLAAGTQNELYAEPVNANNKQLYSERENTNAGRQQYSESVNANAGKPLYSGAENTNTDQASYSEYKNDNGVINENSSNSKSSTNSSEPDPSEKNGEAAAVSAHMENSVNPLKIQEQTLHSDSRGNYIVIAIGFVVLSAIAGIVGFRVHSLSGTKR